MRKFFVIFVILLTACAPKIGGASNPTPTPITLPTLSFTPMPTSTPVVIPPAPTTPDAYVVQSGDTLASVAAKFGLDPNSLWEINKLPDPNMIYPGQVLILKGVLVGPDAVVPAPSPDITSGKEIVVVIHTQRTYAFEDGQLFRTFIVSTGVAQYPTVLGHYSIYVKLRSTDMAGPGYYLPNVPYTMYFYEGYGLHGTYWHHNFGHPMSHGCVNMYTPDAEWLFGWAEVGTPVWVVP